MTRAVDKDGWEYATSFISDFHAGAKRFDFVRRRRWFIERERDPEYDGGHLSLLLLFFFFFFFLFFLKKQPLNPFNQITLIK